MPYIQKQTNNYFGFMPVTAYAEPPQVNSYLVSSSETQIAAGDLVMLSTKDTVKSVAAITGAIGSPTSSQAYLGVAAQTMPANAGSTAATINSNSSQLILVYDNPQQVFVGCDTTSGVIGTQLGQFKNYSILATGAVGSTGPILDGTVNARSNMAISGVTSTLAGAIKVLFMHPIEQGIYSTVGAATAGSAVNVRKWMFQIVQTVWSQSTAVNAIVNTTS